MYSACKGHSGDVYDGAAVIPKGLGLLTYVGTKRAVDVLMGWRPRWGLLLPAEAARGAKAPVSKPAPS